MMQLSPYVLRTAMLMEELGDESKRAAYMVISDMHRLQEEREQLRKMAEAANTKTSPQKCMIPQ